ncbi:MAG: gliding motility-associated C-terminal domain-containing protein [Chitinophagales bacterium]|nr:gliding motility-associated C-terminal domain-containing protein [Chitinophagales bacterium]
MKIIKVLLIVGLLFLCLPSKATHLIGGEMNYRHIANDSFKVTLSVYRDCYLGQADFDYPGYILVYEGDGTFLGYFSIYGQPRKRLPVVIEDECYTAPPNICVEKMQYEFDGILPENDLGYYLSYQRCCRNGTILNVYDDLVDSVLSSGMNLYAYVPPLKTIVNSNPVFNNYPPVAICVNKEFNFDHSAKDNDGDSLVYKLCTPTDAMNTVQPTFQPYYYNYDAFPFQEVRWRSPYSIEDMLGGKDKLKIDAHTGQMTAYPDKIGQFVVGVCVDEYRKGKFISQTRRDFQFNVGECGKFSTAAFFTYDTICNSMVVSFKNESVAATSYFWEFGDGNSSTLASPIHTFPAYGTYPIKLIAVGRNGCSDTITKSITLMKDTFEFSAPLVNFCKGTAAKLEIKAAQDEIQYVQWLLTPSVYTDKLTYSYFPTKSEKVNFVIHTKSGCYYQGSINVVLQNPPNVKIVANPPIIYEPATVTLSVHEDEGYSYFWNSSVPNSSPNAAQTSLYIDSNQWAVVTKTDLANGCVSNDTIYLKVTKCAESGVDYRISKEVLMNCDEAVIRLHLELMNPDITSFVWKVNGEEIENQADIEISTSYGVELPYNLILTQQDLCSENLQFSETIEHPFISYQISPLSICNLDASEILIGVAVDSDVDYKVVWDFALEDTLENTANSVYSWKGSDVVLPFTIIYNDSCQLRDSLPIYFSPLQISASANPLVVNKGDTVHLSVLPDTLSNYFWTSEDANIDNPYIAQPTVVVHQNSAFIVEVTNGECSARDTVNVQVLKLKCTDENIFIPTAFTPNNDGVNDEWLVRFDAATAFLVAIYNRYGEKVFESDDISKGWDGTYKGKISEAGTYAYYLTIVCENQEPYFSKGNITLVR